MTRGQIIDSVIAHFRKNNGKRKIFSARIIASDPIGMKDAWVVLKVEIRGSRRRRDMRYKISRCPVLTSIIYCPNYL